MSDYGFKTNNDFNGPIADLIKINNECTKNGMDIKDFINVLRKPDKKEILEEIRNTKGKTNSQRILEEQIRKENSRDLGIGV